MQITCLANQTLRCTPDSIFELMVDAERFPATFTGYGLIPAIRSITLEAPLAIGATRRIDNADGSTLIEQITALKKPTLHAYTLRGFRAPFSWLVTQGDADWAISATTTGTQVRWRYRFTLAHGWAYPVAACLLRFFMARAMQRCLENMGRILTTDSKEN